MKVFEYLLFYRKNFIIIENVMLDPLVRQHCICYIKYLETLLML